MPPLYMFGTQASGGVAPVVPLVDTYLMGPGVAVRDFVYHSTTQNTANRADATAVATGRAFGIVIAVDTPVVGSCTVLLVGEASGFAGLVPGSAYLLGIAPGVIVESTDTVDVNYPDNVGNVIQVVGYARTASILFAAPAAVLNTV